MPNRHSFIRRGIAAAVITLGSLFAPPARADAGPAGKKLEGKLVCVGDSITAGAEVKKAEAFVSRIRDRAAGDHCKLDVVNQGRSGWSTRSYIENSKLVVKELPADATLVTIMLGTNDTRDRDPADVVAKHCADNLEKLIGLYRAKAPAAEFIVVTPTAIYPAKLSDRLKSANYDTDAPAKVAAIRDAYTALAKRLGLRLVDLTDLPGEDHASDGVHPDAAGHAKIAEKVWDALAEPAPVK